ncbi:MAG TPA: DUF1731 domain-containing protein, partial [Bryobacteraceae bacterium]|nr:DUF1731 domain-containing protein [Bryobacteraceae bacterium]
PVQAPWAVVTWDARTCGDWARELEAADLVINLAGRSVNCRYNFENRRSIVESRVQSTRAVGEAIGRCTQPPAVWMNASTATIYRHALDREMDERTGEIGGGEPGAPQSWKFSIQVARAWEHAFTDAETPNTRKIALRSAMTMSPDGGGIFDALLGLVRKGLGGTAGSGRQYVSWIHEADFVSAVEFLMQRGELDGVINLASPNPIPNREFMRILREAWGTRTGVPASEWMLEIGAVFLKTETELVLKSRRVVPGRLLEAGFQFQYADWESAARELVARWRQGR